MKTNDYKIYANCGNHFKTNLSYQRRCDNCAFTEFEIMEDASERENWDDLIPEGCE